MNTNKVTRWTCDYICPVKNPHASLTGPIMISTSSPEEYHPASIYVKAVDHDALVAELLEILKLAAQIIGHPDDELSKLIAATISKASP